MIFPVAVEMASSMDDLEQYKGVYMAVSKESVAHDWSTDEEAHEGDRDKELVSLNTLAELAGIPADLIKKELLLDGDRVCMDDLRQSMLKFLDASALVQ